AVSVTGRLALSVMFECVDCLREFLASFEIPVEAQYLPGSPSLVAGEHVMPVEEAENYYYRDDVIDLDELVREEVLLAMPYNPLCKPDCRGLCPQCHQPKPPHYTCLTCGTYKGQEVIAVEES